MNNGRRSPWLGVVVGFTFVTIAVGLLLFVAYLLDYFGYISLFLTDPDPDGRIKYLLSATAQVLGALFALVFSITLIAVQLVTKYTHRTMGIVFNNRIIFYMGVFALSVVIPLLFLFFNPVLGGAIISISVGVLVTFSLVPFFLYLRDRMKMDGIIDYIKTECITTFGKRDFDTTEERIKTLDNIAMGAYSDYNFDVFELAESALADLLLEMEKKLELKEKTRERELFDDVIDRLRDTCRDPEVIDNPRAPRIVVERFGLIGVKAIEQGRLATENAATNSIVAIENLCVEKTHIRLSVYCYVALNNMLKATTDVSGQDHLIKKVLDIFDHHLNQEWKDWLPNFLDATLDVMKDYPIGTPELWTRLVNQFFSYFNFWAKQNMLDEAYGNYRQILNLLDFLKEKEYFPRYTKSVLERLGEYAKTALGKNPEWREKVAERIYQKVAGLANTFIENGPHELLPVAQKVYFNSLGTNQLKDESSNMLFRDLLKQISKIGNIQSIDDKYWDAEWSKALTKAFEVTGRQFTKKFGINLIQELWYEIKSTGEWIIKQAFKRGNDWVELLLELHQFFFQSMVLARSSDTLPVPFQEEIFKWTWITFVTFRREGAGWDDLGNYLLQNKGFAKDFFDQYYRAAKEEGMKLGISGDTFEERRGFLAAISQYNLPQSS